jgi:hypothetical protein
MGVVFELVEKNTAQKTYLILPYVRMNGQRLHVRTKQVSIAVKLETYIQEVLSQFLTGTSAIVTDGSWRFPQSPPPIQMFG